MQAHFQWELFFCCCFSLPFPPLLYLSVARCSVNFHFTLLSQIQNQVLFQNFSDSITSYIGEMTNIWYFGSVSSNRLMGDVSTLSLHRLGRHFSKSPRWRLTACICVFSSLLSWTSGLLFGGQGRCHSCLKSIVNRPELLAKFTLFLKNHFCFITGHWRCLSCFWTWLCLLLSFHIFDMCCACFGIQLMIEGSLLCHPDLKSHS